MRGRAGGCCVHDGDGQVRFRDHTDESTPFGFAPLPATVDVPAQRSRAPGEDVDLRLAIEPRADGALTLRLAAHDAETDQVLSAATLDSVAPELTRGGLALAASGRWEEPGASFWFSHLRVTGPGASVRPDCALGPIVGTLFSVSGSVLKLTAQLMPLGPNDPREVWLEVRDGSGPWRRAARAPVSGGWPCRAARHARRRVADPPSGRCGSAERHQAGDVSGAAGGGDGSSGGGATAAGMRAGLDDVALRQVADTLLDLPYETWNFGESVAFEAMVAASRALDDGRWLCFARVDTVLGHPGDPLSTARLHRARRRDGRGVSRHG